MRLQISRGGRGASRLPVRACLVSLLVSALTAGCNGSSGVNSITHGNGAATGSNDAASTVPLPTVEGPITGGSPSGGPWWATPYDLSKYGYVEEEFFLSGTASDRGMNCPAAGGPAGGASGCAPGDGKPNTAPYKVRILVRRPIDPAKFKGTAMLEWANVSLQMEIEHDWAIDFPTVMREGMISAMVSVQSIGVQGPGPFSLKNWAPQRYGSLNQPGDQYSFDIYAQAAQALRSGLITGNYIPNIIIGTGTSQSCLDLTGTYIPYLAAGDHVFDAFMPTLCPAPANTPDDLVPMVFGMSEWEGVLQSRADGPLLRTWYIAGEHINYYEASQATAQLERANGVLGAALGPGTWDEDAGGQYGERGVPLVTGSLVPATLFGNTVPARYPFRAALHWLNRWAIQYKQYKDGQISEAEVQPAPAAPDFARVATFILQHDTDGNVVGGVPIPAIEVPVASYLTPVGSPFGVTVPLDPVRLLTLYPTHDDYVSKMQAATDDAVAGGYMLPEDAEEWMARVKAAPIGGVLGALPAGK